MKRKLTLLLLINIFLAAISIAWGYFEPIPEIPPRIPEWKQISTPFFKDIEKDIATLKIELVDKGDPSRQAMIDVVKFRHSRASVERGNSFRYDIHLGRNKSRQMSVKKTAIRKRALLAINGGFFSKDFKAEGLLVSRGKALNPVGGHGSGVFYVTKEGVPDITWVKDFKVEENIEFAVQAGPLIIEKPSKNGIVNIRKRHPARSAVGITEAGDVFFVHVRRKKSDADVVDGLSLYEFALILLDRDFMAGLKPHSVLNLDGGSSSGLYLNHPKHKLHLPELVRVSNIILVKRR